jgi:hypothetical protein
VQQELRDSCPWSTAQRRQLAAQIQAIVDRRRRSPNLEVVLARSTRVFRRLSRRSRNAAALNRSTYAASVLAACRRRFQSRPLGGTAPGRRTTGTARLDWAFGNAKSKPRCLPARGSLDVNPIVACGAGRVSSAALFPLVQPDVCPPGREQIPSSPLETGRPCQSQDRRHPARADRGHRRW